MFSHPDADAFMRSYLRKPTDATTRLIFADWLEETGDESNVAWARYIRLKVEADTYSFWSPDRRDVETQAARFAPFIRANLTIPAALFVGYPKSLLQLLPSQNITVKLDEFRVDREVVDLVPESVARENFVLPLAVQRPVLMFATHNPWNKNLLRKLGIVMNKDIVLVGASEGELRESINERYGQPEVQYADYVFYDFFPISQRLA
jgi:uncharacterized protein (TIGR02996 family)